MNFMNKLKIIPSCIENDSFNGKVSILGIITNN